VGAQGECTIYERRPFVCRIFAMTDEPALKCPHGRGPKKPMSIDATHKLMLEYKAIREANARDGY
jgi:Fe-S-cluster containining protein